MNQPKTEFCNEGNSSGSFNIPANSKFVNSSTPINASLFSGLNNCRPVGYIKILILRNVQNINPLSERMYSININFVYV